MHLLGEIAPVGSAGEYAINLMRLGLSKSLQICTIDSICAVVPWFGLDGLVQRENLKGQDVAYLSRSVASYK